MKKTLLIMIATIIASATPVLADTWVNGYFRSDGSYVQGHYRSSPNSYKSDNYSTWGNTNPYTGEKGDRYKECRYSFYC